MAELPRGHTEDLARAPLVELRGVVRRYATGTVALGGLDLQLHSGESVAVVGRSGSGKSTLLNILGQLDVPTEGAVYFDGDRVDFHSDRRRSQRRAADLGFVFQRSHLIGALTSAENVALGLRYANWPESDVQSASREALASVGLERQIDSVGDTLSGGEMQRVAIARTLARPAGLWLADEPTGNLDSTQSAEIIELLRDAAADRGACLVVVTHDPEVASRMTRVLTLNDGRIVNDVARAPSDSADRVPEPDTTSEDFPSPQAVSRSRRARRTARFVLQGIGANPRRAWSGIAAAALTVALALSALGLAQSAAAQVTGLFDAQRATQVTARIATDPASPPRWPVRVSAVEQFPGVTGVEFWRSRDAVPMTNGVVVADAATVVEVERAPGSVTDSEIAWADTDNGALDAGEVLLGATLAARLAIAQPSLNPEVTIGTARFRVVGVVLESRGSIALGSAFLSSAASEALPPWSEAVLYAETVPGGARGLADRLADLADPYRQTQMTIDPVLTADSFRGELETSISASLQVLAVLAGLAGLVAVIFVNILSVGSRVAEFGVRRAFGARRGELVSLVIGESSLLGLFGAILGSSIGFLAIMVVTTFSRWQPVFDLRLLVIPLVGALLFGTIAGVGPAIIAGRIEPADAVRS